MTDYTATYWMALKTLTSAIWACEERSWKHAREGVISLGFVAETLRRDIDERPDVRALSLAEAWRSVDDAYRAARAVVVAAWPGHTEDLDEATAAAKSEARAGESRRPGGRNRLAKSRG